MLALACFAREPFASAQDVADTLGVPVAVAAMLVEDLQAAGMIEPAPVQ
jgi:DNA-binding IclR family transcriptional regulator